MKRTLTIGTIVLALVALFATNRHIRSYLHSAKNIAFTQLKGNISPEFEINRLQDEIRNLDSDLPGMVDSLAALDYDIKQNKAKLEKAQTALASHEKTLLEFAETVKAKGKTQFTFLDQKFTPTTGNKKLARDFALYNNLKATVESQQKLLTAQEQRFQVKFDQISKIKEQKQAFETQLTQLATELELLKNNSNGCEPAIDNSRIALIQEGLANLKRQVGKLQSKHDLYEKLGMTTENAPVNSDPAIDPDVVLNAINNQGVEQQNPPVTVNKDE
jgi:chromosome segregation ATPase